MPPAAAYLNSSLFSFLSSLQKAPSIKEGGAEPLPYALLYSRLTRPVNQREGGKPRRVRGADAAKHSNYFSGGVYVGKILLGRQCVRRTRVPQGHLFRFAPLRSRPQSPLAMKSQDFMPAIFTSSPVRSSRSASCRFSVRRGQCPPASISPAARSPPHP